VGTLISSVLRVLIVWWTINAVGAMMDPDYEAKSLRKQIDFEREWNEKIGRHILSLESKYAELVRT
jgi:hypothetical protein